MLVLTPSAIAEIRARRRDPLGRGTQDLEEAAAAEALFDLGDFDFHHFAARHKGHKNHELSATSHAIPSEGDIVDGQA